MGWPGWLGTFTGVVVITVAALPVAALAVWALARRRGGTGTAWRASLAEVGIVYGTAPWVWMIMLPGSGAGVVPGRVSLVPLRDLVTVLGAGPMTVASQIVGNLLVFAALGSLGPLRFAALASVPRVLALAAACSVLVEVAQFVLQLDRVSSVDDVLLNTAGAGLAALASRRWWRGTADVGSVSIGSGAGTLSRRRSARYGARVSMLGPGDALPSRPRRVLVAGTSGSGKTTLAATVASTLGIPHVEIDGLFHGPGWTPRADFEADVRRFVAGPDWATEWQYRQVRAALAERADLLVWLDLTRTRVMTQVVRRTLRRRLRREVLWNGNVEPPLWTILTDREHILRWAWTTHAKSARRVRALHDRCPELVIVHLRTRADVRRWVAGPLRRAAGGHPVA